MPLGHQDQKKKKKTSAEDQDKTKRKVQLKPEIQNFNSNSLSTPFQYYQLRISAHEKLTKNVTLIDVVVAKTKRLGKL